MQDLKNQDLSGRDFTGVDLSQANIAHSDVSGCRFEKCIGANFTMCKGSDSDFSNADISGSTFEKAEESVLPCLIGSTWNGHQITRVSPVLTTGLYWSFATNCFVQIGCTQRTWNDWLAIGDSLESLTAFYAGNKYVDPIATWEWWSANKQTIQEWIDAN